MGAMQYTLGDVVATNARRFGDSVAYRDGSRVLTHAELHSRAVRLASALAGIGLRRQDRIGLLGRNGIDFSVVLAAAQLSGLVVAMPNWRWSRAEVADALRRTSPKVLFCDGEFAPMAAGIAGELPGVGATVAFGEATGHGERFDDVCESGKETLPFGCRAEDLAYLLFTSGTTGAAKCCMIGQREFFLISATMNTEMRTGSADCALINMPTCHVGALAIVGGIQVGGGAVVLQRQFEAADALRMVAAEGATVLHLAPVMLQRVLDAAADARDLASVRTIVYAAAPMTTQLLRRALTALPKVSFVNMYGQTEGIVTGLPPELHSVDDPEVLHSVGFPMPGIDVRITDDTGCDVGAGVTGEIAVRSDSLFRGYWDDQAATMDVLRDGWYFTGDIGRVDKRGLVYLVDRKKDVIITGGENVYSPEVENAVSAHTAVLECAVVGLPDEHWGETVCAVVVVRPGGRVMLAEIQDIAAESLARYKIPRRLVLLDELPRLSSGKVDKKRLRAELARGN